MDKPALNSFCNFASGLLKTMCDEGRLVILFRLLDRECSIATLQSVSPSNELELHRHVKGLINHGHVRVTPDAQGTRYSLQGAEASRIITTLKGRTESQIETIRNF